MFKVVGSVLRIWVRASGSERVWGFVQGVRVCFRLGPRARVKGVGRGWDFSGHAPNPTTEHCAPGAWFLGVPGYCL